MALVTNRNDIQEFIAEVLETEFEQAHGQLAAAHLLVPELHNLVEYCAPVMEAMEFSAEKADDRFLRYAVIGTIADYLEVQREGVTYHGIQ